jgi:hypothetical protein
VELIMWTRSLKEHRDPDQSLDDEETLGQHQRRPEAATGRLFAQIQEAAPEGDEGGDQQPGAE